MRPGLCCDAGYAIYWAKRGQAETVTNKASFLWKKFPKFILGFLAISLLVSFHTFTKDQVTSLANLSRWAFLLTFAGVDLRTTWFLPHPPNRRSE